MEVESKLGQRGEIGAEAGGDDHFIDGDGFGAAVGLARHCDHASLESEGVDTKRCDELDSATVNGCLGPLAERAAARQLIVGEAAEGPLRRRRPHGPENLRRRFFVPEASQAEDRIHRGVSGADDHHAAAGEAFPLRSEHVRDAVADAGRRGPLAEREHAAGAGRVRVAPGARRIDDGARQMPLFAAVGSDGDDLERPLFASFRRHAIHAPAASRKQRERHSADSARSPDATPAEGDSDRSVHVPSDRDRDRASTSRRLRAVAARRRPRRIATARRT